MAVITNIAILILEIIGVRKRKGGFSWNMFQYYTQLSNAAAFIASIVFLASPVSRAAVYLRYLASSMLLMTAFVTMCILVPMGAGFRKMMLSGNGLYHHTLCPLISLVSYLFLEPHASSPFAWILPSVVTLIYGVTMMILNGMRKVDGPYPFFRVHNQTKLQTAFWIIALFAAVSLLAAALRLAAK